MASPLSTDRYRQRPCSHTVKEELQPYLRLKKWSWLEGTFNKLKLVGRELDLPRGSHLFFLSFKPPSIDVINTGSSIDL